jgi:hypothetical protein
MKTINLVLLLVFARGLMACAQVGSLPPDQISANLGPILRIEDKVKQVISCGQVLDSLGGMTEENAKTFKTHLDVFNVYYLAAAIHLAEGNTKSYLAHVKSAAQELHAIEAMLKDKLGELGDFNSAQKKALLNQSCKPRGVNGQAEGQILT